MVYFVISHLNITNSNWTTRLDPEHKRQYIDVDFIIQLHQHPHLVDILGYFPTSEIKDMIKNPTSDITRQNIEFMKSTPIICIIPINWNITKDSGGFVWTKRPVNPITNEEMVYIVTDKIAEVLPMISPNYRQFVSKELENYDDESSGFLVIDISWIRELKCDNNPDSTTLNKLDPVGEPFHISLSYSQNLDNRYRMFLPTRIVDNTLNEYNVVTNLSIDIGNFPLVLSYAGIIWDKRVLYRLDVDNVEAFKRSYEDWKVLTDETIDDNSDDKQIVHKFEINRVKHRTHNIWIDVRDGVILYSSDEDDDCGDGGDDEF